MGDIGFMNDTYSIFALFGNPVVHSLSPVMHRAAYEKMNLHADYIAFCVENLEKAIEGIRRMNIRGVSVTIPFKTRVLPLLDDLDETALKIGAVLLGQKVGVPDPGAAETGCENCGWRPRRTRRRRRKHPPAAASRWV